MKKLPRVTLLFSVLSVVAFGAQAQYAKLDGALSHLVDTLKPQPAVRSRIAAAPGFKLTSVSNAMKDSVGRVLVDIYLDGSVSLPQFVSQLQGVGAEVTGVNPAFRFGAVSAYVPPSAIPSIAVFGGLHLAKLTVRPQRNVGAVTSQGAKVMRADLANTNGYDGAGITVGVLSDSYDGSPFAFTSIRASDDLASGDIKLPKFVIDLVDSGNIDEGRAMMQIVQDVAPAADLCFATAFAGEAAFAANIRTLRTHASCRADVIVDDVFYFDEPFFSDGQVAQAVNDVSTSSILAGRKVSYFSSAGNQGASGGGGSIDIKNAQFSNNPTGLGNINLASVATCFSFNGTFGTKADTSGGWLDLGGGTGTYAVPVSYSSDDGSTIIMQWDDLFYQGKVTTDLNWYLFDSAGNCFIAIDDDNITGDYAAEFPYFSGGPSGNYRMMVARTGAGTRQASRVRLLNLGGGLTHPLFQVKSSPTTFGHSAAASANSVAAYRYTNPASQTSPFAPRFESFSSPGPVTIAFDAAGNRLTVAETRKKPDIAAPDGGNTTFFFPGQDFEGDGFPNFFGTSAAAPHAAGVAALMLQKAGGPGSLTPKQVKSIMQTTAQSRQTPNPGGALSGPLVKSWNVYDGFGMVDAVNALNKIPAP